MSSIPPPSVRPTNRISQSPAAVIKLPPTARPTLRVTSKPSAPTSDPSKKPASQRPSRIISIPSPSAHPTHLRSRSPTARQPSPPIISVQEPLTLLPSTKHASDRPIAGAGEDFSNYLFLGDSISMFWLCYNAKGKPMFSSLVACRDYYHYNTNHYYGNINNLLVKCSGKSNFYCDSLFQKTFQGSLNLACPGIRIEQLSEYLTTDSNIRELSYGKPSTNNVTNIVFNVGTNNLANSPFSTVPSMKPNYDTLLRTIHEVFPYANVLLLAIPPSFITYPDFDAKRREVNEYLSATYSNNPSFPHVKFGNCDSYFLKEGKLDWNDFVDTVHFSPRGFDLYQHCIKKFSSQLHA
jgi:GDSL-like Lipase/Acylhydrolase family